MIPLDVMSSGFDVVSNDCSRSNYNGPRTKVFKGPVLSIMLRAPLCCQVVLVFMEAKRLLFTTSILATQKPQNFQHHKNGHQEVAACNAFRAILDL